MNPKAMNALSSFSLASFEMDATLGGTYRFADALTDVEDQLSLSPQAMGMIGTAVTNEKPRNLPNLEDAY